MGYHSRHGSNKSGKLWQIGLATVLIAGAVGTSGAVALNAATSPQSAPRPETTARQIAHTNPAVSSEAEAVFAQVAAKVATEKTAPTSAPSQGTAATTAEANAPGAGESSSSAKYSLAQFRSKGVVHWGGYKYTYYSQSVLPGGGLRIPGRHVNADGYVADKDGYIVVANSAPKGTVIDTPFGAKGKVYDRGTSGNHMDIYTK